jgi:hypothetical protein
MRLPHISRGAANRLFDGCHAALVWFAVIAMVTSDPDYRGLAVGAMVATALAAAFVAICPASRPALSGDAPAGGPLPRRGSRTSTDHQEDQSHVL